MSGSEFERENIVTDALSAAAASKPAAPAREHSWRPPAEGLYDPSLEKDSCGVGFIANIKGKKSHQIVSDALNILCNLEHRGAVGADPRAGDGAGILVQIPHAFFARKAKSLGFTATAARRLRGRRAVHAEGEGVAQSHPEHHRRPDQGGAIDAARLARRADRQFLARRNRQADRARSHAGIHRPRRPYQKRRRIRAPALYPSQVDFAGDLSAPRPRPRRLLSGLDVVPHRRLQGHVPRRSARQILSRSERGRFR